MRTTNCKTSQALAARPDEAGQFLAEMSVLMGLPAERGQELLQGLSPFWGPGGLMCRLQVNSGRDRVTAVQPQVMLPMPAQELQGQEVGRLLDIQAALLSETGWRLGVSREGMMQLSSTSWIDQPGEAVDALDTGNAVALHTLYLLLRGDDPHAGQATWEDEFTAVPVPACPPETSH